MRRTFRSALALHRLLEQRENGYGLTEAAAGAHTERVTS